MNKSTKDILIETVLNQKITSLVRHLLTCLVGAVAAYGINIPPDLFESLISEVSAQVVAAVGFAAVYVSSLLEKLINK